MIVLDTNVVSEIFRPAPSPRVLQWLAAQHRPDLYVTAVTMAELLYGVERLPEGKRRESLMSAAEAFFQDFEARILPFDQRCARDFSKLVAAREAICRPILQPDGMIAAIARARHASLATRNMRDFEHCGVKLIDPWRE